MGRNILGIFDGDDIADITALIDKLEKPSFDYLKLEGDGVSVVIGKNGAGGLEGTVLQAGPAPYAAAVQASPSPQPVSAPAGDTVDEGTDAKITVAEQEGIVLIKSPNYGLFYAQSEPGAPPYVKIGDMIKAGDTVGLLETMKTFTAISSPSDGEVLAIHVKNEEMLEPDQPLVSIRVKTGL